MIKMFFVALITIVLSFNVFADDTQVNNELPNIEAGKQYVVLKKLPSEEKEVVEIFSFNCPSCFRTDTELKIADEIKENLPEGVVFKKYHLNTFGPLAAELSEAWAIANVLGITKDVSIELYNGIQRDKTIKSADDIKGVFATLGVDNEKYDSMKNNFLVKAFIVQQNEAIKDLKPATIPTFYVNGQYQIDPTKLAQTSNEEFVKDYSRVSNYLSQLN